jgi:hypothetical protein
MHQQILAPWDERRGSIHLILLESMASSNLGHGLARRTLLSVHPENKLNLRLLGFFLFKSSALRSRNHCILWWANTFPPGLSGWRFKWLNHFSALFRHSTLHRRAFLLRTLAARPRRHMKLLMFSWGLRVMTTRVDIMLFCNWSSSFSIAFWGGQQYISLSIYIYVYTLAYMFTFSCILMYTSVY